MTGSAGILPAGVSTGTATRWQDAGRSSERRGELPHLRWRLVNDQELADATEDGNRKAKSEIPALEPAVAQRLRGVLNWNYKFKPATEHAAKSSVTALRRQAEELDEEAEPVFSFKFSANEPARPGSGRKLNAAATGTAHHKFLQHITLKKADDLDVLGAEAKRLEAAGVLTADERAALDLGAVAAFWKSGPGRKIRAQPPDCVRRELAFTAKFSPAEVDTILGKKTRRPDWSMNLWWCRAWRIWWCCCPGKSGSWISKRTKSNPRNWRREAATMNPS